MKPIRFQTFGEAAKAWGEDYESFRNKGIVLANDGMGGSLVQAYLAEPARYNFKLAMDAQPALTTAPNSGIPSFLTNWVDPKVFEVLFSPNVATKILKEIKMGDWTTQTAFFTTVEHTGEVSTYGDFNENGSSGANTNFPQRQSYLYQTFIEYGELEADRAGLAKLNWVSEQQGAANLAMNKFSNLCYFFGVSGLQNYGILNDPNLTAALTPSTKAYGGSKWVNNGQVVATANEIFNDIQSLWVQLVSQGNGMIDQNARVKLCMGPNIAIAMTATNSFGVNVRALLKENFPNIEEIQAVQYGVQSTSNPQGIAAGNLVQMIVDQVEGQETGVTAFNEKMRMHKIVIGSSSWKQKMTGGVWGAVVRQPFGISQMLGV